MDQVESQKAKLLAISPIDGRYYDGIQHLSNDFSEFALIRDRVMLEVEYFLYLTSFLKQNNKTDFEINEAEDIQFQNIYKEFSLEDAMRVKEIEKNTNHDVKAVEYFLRERIPTICPNAPLQFLHFALTSQDVNNPVITQSVKQAAGNLFMKYYEITEVLLLRCQEWMDIPMLAHTHGQPATTTTVSNQINVFVKRINYVLERFEAVYKDIPYKFGGATGGLNAHKVAYPDIDNDNNTWKKFADGFIADVFNGRRWQYTTQIDSYDGIAAVFDNIKNLNNILIDLCQDMWLYISKNYFCQNVVANEVGSSTMAHKVNPIQFENAEGNFKLVNAICDFFSSKLPISRMQRDLTDSTVIRNFGLVFAHTEIAINSLLKGIHRIDVNREVLERELENNWMIVSEAVLTILRAHGYVNAYEMIKDATRTGKVMGRGTMNEIINGLDIEDELKTRLLEITPFNYLPIN